MRVNRVNTTNAGVLLAENARSSSGSGDDTTLRVLLKNVTGTASVFLGSTAAESINLAIAFPWDVADGPLALELEPGEALYGGQGTAQTIAVLEVGRR